MKKINYGIINIDNNDYNVVFIKRNLQMKNIIFKLKNNTIEVSYSRYVDKEEVFKLINELKYKILKNKKKNDLYQNFYVYDKSYFLGKNIEIADKIYSFDGQIANNIDYYSVYKNIIYKKFLSLLNEEKNRLDIHDNFLLKIKIYKSKYGSINLKNKTICLNIILIHFNEDIIKSVIDHELAHITSIHHDKKFYDTLLSYCPNYFELTKKLKNKEYN